MSYNLFIDITELNHSVILYVWSYNILIHIAELYHFDFLLLKFKYNDSKWVFSNKMHVTVCNGKKMKVTEIKDKEISVTKVECRVIISSFSTHFSRLGYFQEGATKHCIET